MNIKDLFPEEKENIHIKRIISNSKYIQKGDLFICIKGKNHDGHNFIQEAIQKGCSFIISEQSISSTVPYKIVQDTRYELSRILNIYYHYPCNYLSLIGVTGTDGKTTTCMLLYDMMWFLQKKCGYIGTNGIYHIHKEPQNIHNTTPGIETILKDFSQLIQYHYKYVSLEVSAQSIDQKRILGLSFKYKIFTNLSHEHMEYFSSMEEYYQAKKSFFLDDSIILINYDCEYGKRLYFELREFNLARAIIRFGSSKECEFYIDSISTFPSDSYFSFYYDHTFYPHFYLGIPGKYNIYNFIPSIIIGILEGFSIQKIKEFAKVIPQVPGRMEKLQDGPYEIIIDFAHTPNGLLELLDSIQLTHTGRIFLVLGAAGEKDKTKRPIMGKIALEKSDYVFFTSEDPREENPKRIILDMLSNSSDYHNYEIILDRKLCIQIAIERMTPNDLVIITGKGLENTMELGNHKTIFHSDYLIAKDALKNKKKEISI